MSWYSKAFTAPLFSVISFLYHSQSSIIHSHVRNQYEFLLVQDAQIYNTFSVWEPVLTVTSTFILQTGCCSWHLFSAVVGSWICSNIENVMVSPASLRSSSSSSRCIQVSLILPVTLLWSLLFLVLIIFHNLDFGEFLCIIIIKMIIANFMHSWYIFYNHYLCIS